MGEGGAIPAHQVFMVPHGKTAWHPFILKTGGSRLENNVTIDAPSYYQADLNPARPHF